MVSLPRLTSAGCNSLSFLLLTPVSRLGRFSFFRVADVLRVVREPACKRRELCVVLFCQSNYTLYHTPSPTALEQGAHGLHSHSTLVSSFKCAVGISHYLHLPMKMHLLLSPASWKVVVLQDGLLLLSLFTYLLVGATQIL